MEGGNRENVEEGPITERNDDPQVAALASAVHITSVVWDPTLTPPPPSYDECYNLSVPPPTYDSLFGPVPSVHNTFSRIADCIKDMTILFFGTVGYTILIGMSRVIPMFMMTIGIFKIGKCTREPLIPIFLIAGSIFGVANNILCIARKWGRPMGEGMKTPDTPTPGQRRHAFLSTFLTVWLIVSSIWVYAIYKPEYFITSSWLYCDYILYQFAFWLVTLNYIFVGLMACMCCLSVSSVLVQNSQVTGDHV